MYTTIYNLPWNTFLTETELLLANNNNNNIWKHINVLKITHTRPLNIADFQDYENAADSVSSSILRILSRCLHILCPFSMYKPNINKIENAIAQRELAPERDEVETETQ